ncbi:MAG: PilX N-terminal domain-containing pilus assembly protein [Deltaproteobacteria bacterium]|nr:PilX N-terminal domain-containing pilus assembly protein [Deltaproteobacteria bacterium]
MTVMREKIRVCSINSQDGAALLIAVLILLILTVIGVYAVTTATLDTKISGFHKWHVEAFYAGDAGLNYALAEYPYGGLVSGSWTHANLPNQPNFNVTATYLCETPPPVGSGTGTRAGFMAHHFRTDSVGSDSAGIASSTVHMWGYRLGF